MSPRNQRELETTGEKLRRLEERFTAIQGAPTRNPYVRELTLWSLKGLINQMKEEIVRFEARATAPAERGLASADRI